MTSVWQAAKFIFAGNIIFIVCKNITPEGGVYVPIAETADYPSAARTITGKSNILSFMVSTITNSADAITSVNYFLLAKLL